MHASQLAIFGRSNAYNVSTASTGCPTFPHKLFGIIVCLLATLCFLLGIADVVFTYLVYCYLQTAACASSGVYLTWVAVGTWASVPVRCFSEHTGKEEPSICNYVCLRPRSFCGLDLWTDHLENVISSSSDYNTRVYMFDDCDPVGRKQANFA